MRRQLAIVALATTSLVVLALLIPLARAISTIPRDRGVADAQLTSQALAQSISAVRDPANLQRLVEQVGQIRERPISVVLPDGSVLGAGFVATDALRKARAGESVAAYLSGGDLEVLTPTATGGGIAVVRVVVPDRALRRGVLSAWAVLGLLGLLLVVLAVAVSDRLARSIVKPITALAATTRALEQGDLDARVAPAGPPEVREVGHTLNLLADRIDDLVVTEREAIADLSHRLRTPITALRLDAEGLRDEAESRRILAGVDEVTRAVDNLIRTAREPTRRGGVSCDLIDVVRGRVAFWTVLAEEQARDLSIDIPTAVARVPLAAETLSAAIDVLIENVFAHTDEGVGFSVAVDLSRGSVAVHVIDDGPGFDAAAAERGTSGSGSTGLGLNIARSTAEDVRGTFAIVRDAGRGAHVTIELPLLSAH